MSMYRSKSMDFGSLLQKWQVKGDDEEGSEKKASTKSFGASKEGRFVVPKSTKDLRERFQSPGINTFKERPFGSLSRNEDFKLNLKYKSTTDLREKFQNRNGEVPFKGRSSEFTRTYGLNGNSHGFGDIGSKNRTEPKIGDVHIGKNDNRGFRRWKDEAFRKTHNGNTRTALDGNPSDGNTRLDRDAPRVNRTWRKVAPKELLPSKFDEKLKSHVVSREHRSTAAHEHHGSELEKSETDDEVISDRDDRQLNQVNGNIESSSESEESSFEPNVSPAEFPQKKIMDVDRNEDRPGQKGWDNWKTNAKEIAPPNMSSNIDTSENERPTRSANFRAKWQSKFRDLYGDSDDDVFNVVTPKVKHEVGEISDTKAKSDSWETDKPSKEEPTFQVEKKMNGFGAKWQSKYKYLYGDSDSDVFNVVTPKVKHESEEVSGTKAESHSWETDKPDREEGTFQVEKKIIGFGLKGENEKDELKDVTDSAKISGETWGKKDDRKVPKENNGQELENKLEKRRNGGNVPENRWKMPQRNTTGIKERNTPRVPRNLNSAAKKWKEMERENLDQPKVKMTKNNQHHWRKNNDQEKSGTDNIKYKTQSVLVRPKANKNLEKSSEDGSTYDSESGSDFGSNVPSVVSKEILINEVEYFETADVNETKQSKSKNPEPEQKEQQPSTGQEIEKRARVSSLSSGNAIRLCNCSYMLIISFSGITIIVIIITIIPLRSQGSCYTSNVTKAGLFF